MVKYSTTEKKLILGSLQTIVNGSLQTTLLCIVGHLSEGGFVALAIGVSEMWQVTGDTQHMTVTPYLLNEIMGYFCISSTICTRGYQCVFIAG